MRHHTPRAVSITVPFGVMERAPTMSAPDYQALLEGNRARVSTLPKLSQETRSTPAEPNAKPETEPGGEQAETTVSADTPRPAPKPHRPPKDDLNFYID
ncbi:MAG: hypothetical protein IPL87_05295 [Candidatus Moraniibacteriota bacterium]|nr:MAG: hypothetical protein IPL87_05295 [Candidatus Moranbacteria bacterium]